LAITWESEEYLEAIYRLQETVGVARTTDLARQLNVTLGSVTNTVESLERRGLVTHKPYRGVRLSEKGRAIALKVLRKHRLAERLLTDILGMDWTEVHEVACQLEHAIPDKMIPLLEKALKFPKTCPHGNIIPTETEETSKVELISLTRLEPHQTATVARIIDESKKLLQSLATHRIKPNVKIQMLEKNLSKGFIKIKTADSTCVLEHNVASAVLVRKLSRSVGKNAKRRL